MINFKKAFLLIFTFIIFLSQLRALPGNDDDKIQGTGLVIESQEELDASETSEMFMVRSDTRRLPSRVNLEGKMPPVGSQGRQGSCVAWATTYFTKSYHEKIKNRWAYGWGNYTPYNSSGRINPSKGNHVFSPAWTYNQINHGRDRGSSISNALKLLVSSGAVPWSIMPYNHKDYLTQPTYQMKQLARNKYRSKNYSRVNVSDPDNIKREIVNGNPVIGGFKVTRRWKKPPAHVKNGGVLDDYSGSVTGGHAMAVVGYDDNKRSPSGHRGAFRIINSWGKNWGDNGYFWMSYKSFSMLCKYAYVLYDSEQKKKPDKADITVLPTTNISASRGTYSNRIYISWNRVENAVSYQLERSLGRSNSFERYAIVNYSHYYDYNVQPDYRYNYRVVSISTSGRSKADASPVAEGYALAKKNNKPSQITNLYGISVSGGRSVNLSWSVIGNASYYSVIRYDQYNRKWKTLGSPKKPQFSDRRPLKKIPNYYYVAAVNRSGAGKWSNMVKITITESAGPPGTVTGMNATSGKYNDRIDVSWNAEASAKHYLLYRWNTAVRKWDKSLKVYSNSYSDMDSSIRGGRKYTYTVKAYNNMGNSPRWSTYVSGYTANVSQFNFDVKSILKVKPPGSPAIKIDKNSRKITLTWKPSAATESYRIYRKKEGKKKFRMIKSVSGKNGYTEKFPGRDGDIFFYYITSKELDFESERSEILTATIEVFKPVVMTAFVPGDGLKNFRGTWRASHLIAEGKSVKMEIRIINKGAKFTADLFYGKKRKKMSGNYASKSRYLEAKNFSLRMLPAFDNDIANVVIPAGVFTSSRLEINFAREKQD